MSETDDSTTPSPLAGLRVLVTRPAAAAASLAQRIEAQGGKTEVFPVIDIVPPADADALRVAVREFASGRAVDLAVFISAHAASAVATQLKRLGMKAPTTTRIAAVGPRTKAACAASGLRVDFAPTARIDSEGLLDALCGFNAGGRRIMIFRGQDGRETLAWGLRARGAEVRHVESYRRRLTRQPVMPLIELWEGGGIGAVVASSGAVWNALGQLLGPHRALLERTVAVAYSERIADYCRDMGATQIITAERPNDEAVVEALVEYRRTKPRQHGA